MDKMSSENKPSVWKNVVQAGLALALGATAAARETNSTRALEKGILNFAYSPAMEMNVGHVSEINYVNSNDLHPGEISLQNQIIDEALEAGIPPRSVAILRIESDIAKDQQEKRRGGDPRGGKIAIMQEEGNGNFWIVGEKNPGGSVGAIKDPTDAELSISPLVTDQDKFPGQFITIAADGTSIPVISINGSQEAGYINAGMVIEGVKDGDREERTVPFGRWNSLQLASLNLPGPIVPLVNAATPTPESPVRLPGDLEIISDIEQDELFPKLDFAEIQDPAFVKTLIDMYNRGLLPMISDLAVTPEPGKSIKYLYGNDNSTIFKNRASNNMFHLDTRIPISDDQHGWEYIGFWDTNLPDNPNKPALFHVVGWKNNDGSIGLLGYLSLLGPTRSRDQAIEGIKKAIDNNYIPTGGYYVNTSGKDGCVEALSKYPGDTTFCSWYYKNPDTVYASDIFKRWEETGILSNIITSPTGETEYRLPITTTRTYER